MTGLCLTREELAELTGRIRPSVQRRALDRMGLESRTRADGTLAVLRSALEPAPARPAADRELELDLRALEHVA